MKKTMLTLIVAAIFTACTSGTQSGTATDSAAVAADTVVTVDPTNPDAQGEVPKDTVK